MYSDLFWSSGHFVGHLQLFSNRRTGKSTGKRLFKVQYMWKKKKWNLMFLRSFFQTYIKSYGFVCVDMFSKLFTPSLFQLIELNFQVYQQCIPIYCATGLWLHKRYLRCFCKLLQSRRWLSTSHISQRIEFSINACNLLRHLIHILVQIKIFETCLLKFVFVNWAEVLFQRNVSIWRQFVLFLGMSVHEPNLYLVEECGSIKHGHFKEGFSTCVGGRHFPVTLN